MSRKSPVSKMSSETPPVMGLTDHIHTVYQHLKPIGNRAFLETVAAKSITFDPLDIMYQAPVELLKQTIPFVTKGVSTAYQDYQKQKNITAPEKDPKKSLIDRILNI